MYWNGREGVEKLKVFLELDSQNRVTGWGSSLVSEKCVEIDIPDHHEFFSLPFSWFVYINNALVKDDTHLLDLAKERKNRELNEACNQTILNGFDYTIHESTYHFSFDMEAQLNFQDAESALKNEDLESVNWTVMKDGKYERIAITKEIMDELKRMIFQHKNSNISRYRDFFLPKVSSASNIQEVESISWY